MKNKNKDKKIHENIIGKIIYAFLLFMPLLAIGVTCAYAIFNKNAYQSTAMVQDTKYELIGNQENFEVRNYYQFYTNSNLILNNRNQTIKFKNFASISGYTQAEILNIEKTNQFEFYQNQNGKFIHFSLNGQSENYYFQFANTEGVLSRNLIFNFQFDGNNNLLNNYQDNIYLLQFGQSNLLDNVFYYSIDKVQESPLFNWAKDSAIYTGMTTTCNALNITTPFIPLLTTYWLIISIIYILYDIILVILHIFHKKIHQLEDSF